MGGAEALNSVCKPNVPLIGDGANGPTAYLNKNIKDPKHYDPIDGVRLTGYPVSSVNGLQDSCPALKDKMVLEKGGGYVVRDGFYVKGKAYNNYQQASANNKQNDLRSQVDSEARRDELYSIIDRDKPKRVEGQQSDTIKVDSGHPVEKAVKGVGNEFSGKTKGKIEKAMEPVELVDRDGKRCFALKVRPAAIPFSEKGKFESYLKKSGLEVSENNPAFYVVPELADKIKFPPQSIKKAEVQ